MRQPIAMRDDDDDRTPFGGEYSMRSGPFPGLQLWLRSFGRARWLIVIAVGVVIVALVAWRSLG